MSADDKGSHGAPASNLAPGRPVLSQAASIDVMALLPVVLEVWRVAARARREAGTPPSVLGAVQTSLERLRDVGFELRDMVGEPYHEGMRVRVVDHDGGDHNLRISECLSPAVYYLNSLIKPAEVVVKGDI